MIYTLENGLQTLTDTLKAEAERLGVLIHTNTPATSISFGANNKATVSHLNYNIWQMYYFQIQTSGQEYNADHVIATISAQRKYKLFILNITPVLYNRTGKNFTDQPIKIML